MTEKSRQNPENSDTNPDGWQKMVEKPQTPRYKPRKLSKKPPTLCISLPNSFANDFSQKALSSPFIRCLYSCACPVS